MTLATINQVKALIQLLCAEESRTNTRLVREKIIELGTLCIPFLEEALVRADMMEHERIESVLQDIRWLDLEGQFRSWAGKGSGPSEPLALPGRARGVGASEDQHLVLPHGPPQIDLEEGAFLLARFCYPDLDVAKYKSALDRMAVEVKPGIKSLEKSSSARLALPVRTQGLGGTCLPAGRSEERRPHGPDIKVVRILNDHLFNHLGFHGNTVNYYDPDNSYLNQVIDQRMGIPISLSVVMLLVAKRLGLPLVGVGLPGHFLIRYEGAGQKTDQHLYIDPFNRGQILSKEECTKFIKEAGYEYREEYFRTSTSSEILVRMMRNLIFVYNRLREIQKVEWLSRYVMAIT